MLRKLNQLIALNKGSNRFFIPAFAAGLANMVCMMIPAQVLNMIITAIREGDREALAGTVGIALGGAFLSVTFIYLNQVLIARALNGSEKNLQLKMLDRLFQMPRIRLDKITTGEFLTRINQNIPDAVRLGFNGLYSLVTGFIGLALVLAYMIYLSPELAAGIVIFNIFIMAVTTWTGKIMRKAGKQRVELNDEGNTLLMELLNNSMAMRLFGSAGFFQNLFSGNEENIGRINLRIFTLHQGTMEIIWSVKKIAEIALLYGLGGWLAVHGRADLSIIAAYTLLSDVFTKVLKLATDSIITLNQAVPHIEAAGDLLEETSGQADCGIAAGGEEGTIIFEDVTFRHGDRIILDRASFRIDRGDKVMVTGENGAGKSTLLHLISGLYKPDSGAVIRGRLPLAYIPQEPHILTGNAGENITLMRGGGGSENESDILLNRLNMDRSTRDDPETFSGGEKQRLTIGRALYHGEGSAIVLGDEIFSAVDRGNRGRIIRLLEEYFRDKTVLLVCHDKVDFPFNRELCIGGGRAVLTEREPAV